MGKEEREEVTGRMKSILVLSPSGAKGQVSRALAEGGMRAAKWPLSVLGEQCFSAEIKPLQEKLWLAGHRRAASLG